MRPCVLRLSQDQGDQDRVAALLIQGLARAAFDENLTSYKHPPNGTPALFVFTALLIASNGTDSRVGSLTADWEWFMRSSTARVLLIKTRADLASICQEEKALAEFLYLASAWK